LRINYAVFIILKFFNDYSLQKYEEFYYKHSKEVTFLNPTRFFTIPPLSDARRFAELAASLQTFKSTSHEE